MSRQVGFACEKCRAGKRKCDARKPVCSLCLRQNRECVYTESRPRKRKYWDEDYVRGLEAQVQSLLSILETHQSANNRAEPPLLAGLPGDQTTWPHAGRLNDSNPARAAAPIPLSQPGPSNDGPKQPTEEVFDARSPQAMEELCVMLWRTNVADGVTIINDPTTGTQFSLDESSHKEPATPMAKPPDKVLAHCQDMGLIHEFATLFLENINRDHQFTSYTSTDFLTGFPHQSIEDAFLHSAIIAAGSTFSTRSDAMRIGDDFAEFAESLAFSCCRHTPSVKVVQGLSMGSWRSLALGRDHFGWMFISMAAGMCVHLRLHVLALDECDARRLEADEEDIRVFWMFYIIDRTAISILGRNCALPWRRVNVPSFESTFDSATATLAEVAFAAQCQLWYLHDGYMDQVFSDGFNDQPVSRQVHTLVSSQDALNAFFRSRNPRLHLSGDTTPKPVLLFHLAYQMTILITMPPFLRVFASAASSPQEASSSNSELMLLVLRSLTAAATSTVRLVRTYKRAQGFSVPANPVIIHHLLSAGIVHLMNATSQVSALRHQSGYWLRQCLELLRDLRIHWPVRANKSIKVIRVLAQRWGVTACLPIDLSYRVEPNRAEAKSDNSSSNAGEVYAAPNLPAHATNFEGGSYGMGESGLSLDVATDFTSFDMASFSTLANLSMPEITESAGQHSGDLWEALGSFSNCDDFGWLTGL